MGFCGPSGAGPVWADGGWSVCDFNAFAAVFLLSAALCAFCVQVGQHALSVSLMSVPMCTVYKYTINIYVCMCVCFGVVVTLLCGCAHVLVPRHSVTQTSHQPFSFRNHTAPSSQTHPLTIAKHQRRLSTVPASSCTRVSPCHLGYGRHSVCTHACRVWLE